MTTPIVKIGPFFIGQTADHALQCIKASGRPRGKDRVSADKKNGYVLWDVGDVILHFRKSKGPNDSGPYIVVKITKVEKEVSQ